MDRLTYERGVLDGFEIALRIHRRHWETQMRDLADARKALTRWRQDAQRVLVAIQNHQLGKVAMYFGFDDVWTPERVERLRALVPLEVEVQEDARGASVVER